MITLFDTYTGGITGTNTSIIDLYFFLKDKVDLELAYKLKSPILFKDILIDMQHNFTGNKDIIIDRFIRDTIQSDIIITTTETLVHMKTFNITFHCDKLIFLDSTGLLREKYNGNIDSHFNLKDYVYANEVILLGNPSSKEFECHVDTFIEYYHKFSQRRLDYISTKVYAINKILTTRTDIDNCTHVHVGQFKKYFGPHNKIINNCDLTHLSVIPTYLPHNCSTYEYERWYQVIPNIYIENIGKLIFEFCYSGKTVYYSCNNKTIKDGLHYYLKLFDINDSLNHVITLSKKRIEDKLIYNDSDLILELL